MLILTKQGQKWGVLSKIRKLKNILNGCISIVLLHFLSFVRGGYIPGLGTISGCKCLVFTAAFLLSGSQKQQHSHITNDIYNIYTTKNHTNIFSIVHRAVPFCFVARLPSSVCTCDIRLQLLSFYRKHFRKQPVVFQHISAPYKMKEAVKTLS